MNPVSPFELKKIRKQFTSNLQVIKRVEATLEIIKAENAAMMKLISEVKPGPDADDLLQIKINKAIARRNSQFNL